MAAIVENRMVMDKWWEAFDRGAWGNGPIQVDVEQELSNPGYTGRMTGAFVSENNAYDYALERMQGDYELQQEFVEWFYSYEKGWDKEE